MLSEVFQSCATFIFPFHISKATQKRRHEKILNDELNIHITYIFHMIFCWVAFHYIFILTMYRCIFIYWEWLINICFASILIGFTTFDWNKKTLHQVNTSSMCTRLSLRELFRVSFFIRNKRGIVLYFPWIDGETNNLS